MNENYEKIQDKKSRGGKRLGAGRPRSDKAKKWAIWGVSETTKAFLTDIQKKEKIKDQDLLILFLIEKAGI